MAKDARVDFEVGEERLAGSAGAAARTTPAYDQVMGEGQQVRVCQLTFVTNIGT